MNIFISSFNMEVNVNGFKYSALSSGVIFLPFCKPNNFVRATRSSIRNLILPARN